LALANPPATFNWQIGSTSDFTSGSQMFVTLTAAQLQHVAAAAADYVQACYNTLQSILTAVGAGTITTEAQVIGAGWPSQSL
jgi:Na+-driven multidrug efflux pump